MNFFLLLIAEIKKTFALGKDKLFLILMLAAMLILLTIVSNAQNTISMSHAIHSGLTNKKNILAGKLDSSITHLQTQALYRKYWPQMSAEYSYLYNPILQTSILPIGVFNPNYPIDATKSVQFGTKWTQTAGLTASLPLLDISIKRRINESNMQERISSISQAQSEYELAYAIAQTYIDVCLEEAKIKSLIADTTRTFISYSLLKNKFDEKRLLKSDLNKSKMNHNTTLQRLKDGIADLVEDKVYLLYLMGTVEIEKWDFDVDTTFISNFSKESLSKPIQIDQLPDLQKLVLQSELTKLQSQSEKSKHVPIVSFKGFLGANQYSNNFDPTATNTWFGAAYLGLNIKVPILFGENPQRQIEQLQLQSLKYALQKEDAMLQYSKDLFSIQLKIENLKQQIKTQEENILLSKESIAIFQARVQEGQESASNLNLEEANLEILESECNSNRKKLWVYWLDHLKASGQLFLLWK